jgi:hypothetical protein
MLEQLLARDRLAAVRQAHELQPLTWKQRWLLRVAAWLVVKARVW